MTRKVRKTQVDSLKKLKPAKARNSVYGVIKSKGQATNRMIAKALGWEINRVTGRVTELVFGVNFGDDGEWYMGEKSNGKSCEMMDLNILNPEFNGLNFRVRIVETTEPTDSQQKYADSI